MNLYPAMDRNGIPSSWVITPSLAAALERVENAGRRIETAVGSSRSSGSPLESRLAESARHRSISASCRLEGGPFEAAEVALLLNGQPLPNPFKPHEEDIRSIRNYSEALSYANQVADIGKPVTVPDFCAIQKRLMNGFLPPEACGRIRTLPMAIYYIETGEKIADCPDPDEVRELMDEMSEWLQDTSDAHPVLRAIAFHFMAREIHPFMEGNRRASRLMQHLLLLERGVRIARWVSVELEILARRESFPQVIQESRKTEKLEPFLEFIADSLAIAAERSAEEAAALAVDRRPPNFEPQNILD